MMTFPTEWKHKIHVPNHQPGTLEYSPKVSGRMKKKKLLLDQQMWRTFLLIPGKRLDNMMWTKIQGGSCQIFPNTIFGK